MKKIIQKLFLKLFGAGLVECPATRKIDPVKWTNDHAKGLNAFFQTNVGKDFLAKLEEIEMGANAWAVSQWSKGGETGFIAKGIQHAYGQVRVLSQYHVEDPEFTDKEIDDIISNRVRIGACKPQDLA